MTFPRGRRETQRWAMGGFVVLPARPGTRPQLFRPQEGRVRPCASSSFWATSHHSRRPGAIIAAIRPRSFVNHGAQQRLIVLRTYRKHTPSSVSNGARVSESELKIDAALALPQNARRSLPGPASGLPRRHSTRRGAAPPLRARPRSHTQTSHPARPLADERYLVVRKAALEDAHDLPAMRQGLLPPAEEGVRLVRLPGRQDAPV